MTVSKAFGTVQPLPLTPLRSKITSPAEPDLAGRNMRTGFPKTGRDSKRSPLPHLYTSVRQRARTEPDGGATESNMRPVPTAYTGTASSNDSALTLHFGPE